MVGRVVTSTAGHDKGKLYVVIGQQESQVVLCDGYLKPLAKPKRKNIKHVRLSGGFLGESFIHRLEVGDRITDEEIKHALKVITEASKQASEVKSSSKEGANLEEFYVEK
jgi:hypothetical protein